MLEYYNPVYRLTGTILYNLAEAEEAAQETFIRAIASLDKYQAGIHLKNWLFKIDVNICCDKLRRQKAGQNLMETLRFSYS